MVKLVEKSIYSKSVCILRVGALIALCVSKQFQFSYTLTASGQHGFTYGTPESSRDAGGCTSKFSTIVIE